MKEIKIWIKIISQKKKKREKQCLMFSEIKEK